MEKKNFVLEIHYFLHYYLNFFTEQNYSVQKKLNWTPQLVATLEHIPAKYFKHLEKHKKALRNKSRN